MLFKTTEPTKVYRVRSSQDEFLSGNYFSYDLPVHRSQVEVDLALGSNGQTFIETKIPGAKYDQVVEVEIPAGVYVYLGYAADQGGKFKGGGMQMWIDDVARDKLIEWDRAIVKPLAQY